MIKIHHLGVYTRNTKGAYDARKVLIGETCVTNMYIRGANCDISVIKPWYLCISA